MYNISDDFFRYVEEGKQGRNKGHPFTIAPLNGLINGILPATYYLIAGPSGSGKSTLLYEQFILTFVDAVYAKRMKAEDIVVLLFSLEISPIKFYTKATARFIYKRFKKVIPPRKINNSDGNTTEIEYSYINSNETKHYLSILDSVVKVFTDIKPSTSFTVISRELSNRCRVKGKGVDGKPLFEFYNKNLKFIVALDHISLTDYDKGDILKSTIDKISKKVFVRFRNSHNITVVTLQQITPSDDNMKKVVYSHKDIRDSKNPYQDCDVFLSIGSPLEAHKETIKTTDGLYHVIPTEANGFLGLKNRIRVIAKEKDRDGESFKKAVVGFIGEASMFTDLGKPSQLNYNFYENIGK